MKTFVQMNEQMHATILMVTHDASMAAYAGRVLFLKDGRIWKEQIKNGQSNQAFYEVILKNMTLLEGGADACYTGFPQCEASDRELSDLLYHGYAVGGALICSKYIDGQRAF